MLKSLSQKNTAKDYLGPATVDERRVSTAFPQSPSPDFPSSVANFGPGVDSENLCTESTALILAFARCPSTGPSDDGSQEETSLSFYDRPSGPEDDALLTSEVKSMTQEVDKFQRRASSVTSPHLSLSDWLDELNSESGEDATGLNTRFSSRGAASRKEEAACAPEDPEHRSCVLAKLAALGLDVGA